MQVRRFAMGRTFNSSRLKWILGNIILSILSLLGIVEGSFADRLSVSEFRQRNPETGIFTITGYIAKQYVCPPCPPHANCKPCAEDQVLVSQVNQVLAEFPQNGNYLVVFTENPEKLRLGSLYAMTIEVLSSKSTGYGVHDLRLKEAVEP